MILAFDQLKMLLAALSPNYMLIILKLVFPFPPVGYPQYWWQMREKYLLEDSLETVIINAIGDIVKLKYNYENLFSTLNFTGKYVEHFW